MITFETSFVCDGQIVFGKENTCLAMTSRQGTQHRPDTRLPEGWLAVLLAGDARRELCPRCAQAWRAQQIARAQPLEPEVLNEFVQRCRRFDWNYAWTDDHGYYVDKDREHGQLLAEARRHPVLMSVFKARGRGDEGKTTSAAKSAVCVCCGETRVIPAGTHVCERCATWNKDEAFEPKEVA